MPRPVTTLRDLQAYRDLPQSQLAVIAAASILFAQNGVAATTTHEVAYLAGVAESLVYRRFKTKSGLLNVVCAPFFDEIVPQMTHTIAAITAAAESVQAFVAGFAKQWLTFTTSYRDLLTIVTTVPAYAERWQQAQNDLLQRALTVPITHYQRIGALITGEPARIGRDLIGIWAGEWIIDRPFEPSPVALDRFVAAHLNNVLTMLTPPAQNAV